jgi:DNA polymerase-3 subunit alpha
MIQEDGKIVKYAGIITSVKKKYTRNNTPMAFLTVEDLYGTCEIIVFERTYEQSLNLLILDSLVVIEGRLSLREDEDAKIVANSIKSLTDTNIASNEVENITKKPEILYFDITGIQEEQKAKLRGMIRFFTGDRNNMRIQVVDNGEEKPCGAMFITEEIKRQFEELLGKEKVEWK